MSCTLLKNRLKFSAGQRIRFKDGIINTTGAVTSAKIIETKGLWCGFEATIHTPEYRVVLDNDGWDRVAFEDQITALAP